MGNRIAALRKKNGFTQEKLAEEFGITAQAVSKWENGHTLPETALLPLLSKLLNSSIDSILMPITLEIGDVIPFGKYQWCVLDTESDKALIITENVIEERAFHSGNNDMHIITWEHSDIREYLNGKFYKQFSTADQAKIIEAKIINLDNPWYGTRHFNDTIDKVFLLSYEEVVRYFGDSGDLENRRGIDEGIGLPFGDAIKDEYNKSRSVLNLNGFNAWWWLRSPGGPRDHTDNDHVTAGSVDNVIWLCGDDVKREDGGVRPALWLRL
ncbi:MAG: helix-turn-helix domain-containing protein [Oscillospiraceae bacterium]|nr:helix-turn-helix domain-containing protein [Oscillospiraceae bacterium]